MIILTAIIVVIVTPVVLVTAFFAVEVMAGLRPLRGARAGGLVPRTAIVVPAHNEEGVIAETVRALIEAAPGALVLVVADNCTDGTAALAREGGAQVLVRDDPDRRGKGFALAAAREWLRSDPPDVVLIIDADCWADRASIDALARSASASGRPCQAVY
nr:glycosyltransferase [Sphingomonas sp.]